MGPFDRFNDRAKRVLALAQDEAIRFNHNYIGTEHLLLGLVREGEGVAARVLDSLGVELSKVRTAVEFIIGRGDSTTSPSEITLSPRTKKVIELAIDEARKLGHSHVGTEHLLLGLVREGEGIAFRLKRSGTRSSQRSDSSTLRPPRRPRLAGSRRARRPRHSTSSG
jgi:ATP-dependent Clp protease ATP-binding subunit ClpC